MRSTFHGLETAKRSLFTQQAALNTTGHNIANANTPGFSRQRVNFTESRPLEPYGFMRTTIPGQLGTGVEFDSITRIREKFLDDQFRNENKSFGNWNIQYETLEKLEAIINEPSDTGIRTVMDNFWKSWSELSKNPENVTARKIVRENALALTDAFNEISRKCKELTSDLQANIEVKAQDVSSTLSTVANLSEEIVRLEGLKDNANDLRDQRDYLVDQLSKMINININESDEGYQIKLGEQVILLGGTFSPITDESLLESFKAGDLQSGEIYGLIFSQEKIVENYLTQFDTFVKTLADGECTIKLPKASVLPEGITLDGITYNGADCTLKRDLTVKINGVNGLHRLGYTLTSEIGEDFFTSYTEAGTITLNSKIQENPNLIATSMRVADGAVIKGNNTLALLMSDLQNTSFEVDESTKTTLDDIFRSIVGQLGVQTREAERQSINLQVLVEQVNEKRRAVSGVSLDEELSNMIKFQHAYSAAARFLTSYDEILDKLINGTGVVGR